MKIDRARESRAIYKKEYFGSDRSLLFVKDNCLSRRFDEDCQNSCASFPRIDCPNCDNCKTARAHREYINVYIFYIIYKEANFSKRRDAWSA